MFMVTARLDYDGPGWSHSSKGINRLVTPTQVQDVLPWRAIEEWEHFQPRLVNRTRKTAGAGDGRTSKIIAAGDYA